MIRFAVRIAALLTLVVLMCVTDAYIRQQEDVLPQGAEGAVLLDLSDSTISKQRAVEDLDALSDQNDLHLAKVVADKQDFLHGKNLYAFGKSTGATPVQLAWYEKSTHGVLESSSRLGDADLNGMYVFRGDGAEVIGGWARQNHVTVTVLDTRAQSIAKFTLVSSGYGVALICSLILLLVSSMGWSVLSAHSKALRVVAGQSRAAIIAADIRSYLTVAGPVLVGGYVLGVIAVALLRADHAVSRFLWTSVPFLLAFLLLLVVTFAAMTLIAAPTAEVIAQRRSGILAYRSLSEALKLVAIALTAVSLPIFTSAAMTSLGSSTNASYWKVFGDDVSLRILTASEDSYQATEPRLAQLVGRAESSHEALLNYRLSPESSPASDFDGVVLTNTAYLDQVRESLGADLESVAGDSAADAAVAGLSENLSMWCARACSASDFELFTTAPDAVFPALDGAGDAELALLHHPLVLNTDRIAGVYRPDFIGPLLTSGNIVFSSGSSVSRSVDELGLGNVVLSIDRVADTGLQQGQSDYERAGAQIVGIALLLMALVLSSAIAAQVYIATIARRVFVCRCAGMSWPRVLERRLVYEAAAVCVCAALAFIYGTVQGVQYSWTVFVAPVLYLLISYPAHVVAGQTMFDRSVLRKV